MECAKTMIQQIADAGAQAAKFQTYKASKLAAKNSPAYWDLEKESTTSQFDLFKKFDSFGRDEYVELAGFCQEKNIDGFRVLIPSASSHLLDGIEIDYTDRLMGGGFKINNPNAASTCGCGESFA